MPNMRLVLAAGLIAAGLCQPPLAQAEEKPVAEVKTKAFEGSIAVDARLKAYPALYAKLVANGKQEMAKWRADADKERKTNPQMFANGRQWSFSRSFTARSIIGRYVSVLWNDDTDGGGAHPNHYVNTLLWDAKSDKFINIKPLFTEMADNGPTMQTLAKAIRVALAKEKKARDIDIDENDESLASVKAKITDIGAVALAPSAEKDKSAGLVVYFPPYAVGSYVEGGYTVFVPFSRFKSHLSPEGAALFGGERAADDEKND